jgi:hypothetical protein
MLSRSSPRGVTVARGRAAPAAPATPRLATVAVRAQAGQKVNKRGKVASRPGPQNSRKEEAKQIREQRQVRRLQGDVDDDAQPTSTTTPLAADAAPVDPSLPSSSSPPSSSAVASGPGTTPQVVVDRMFRRMLVSAGAPVLLALALLPCFYYTRVVMKLEYPPWLVYLVQGALFGGGLLGITYGILSTSWEPRREGSALGFDEFKANVALLLSRRNGGGK